ncbi:putative periplasmic serine endoprotease DegP-like precursor [Planctomycetes bacterium MalM25]|nr:putative periplasmic serine endoprotease DegP-like precursor [Planctomycetes bacterium MalM25]
MKTFSPVGLLCLSLLVGSLQAQSLDQRYEAAIDAAVASAEDRLVRLRYFGDGGEALGASAAPVTGWRLGGGWVLTSDYGLAQAPAAIIGRRLNGEPSRYALVARDHSRRLVLLKEESSEPGLPPRLDTTRAARVGETAIALGAVYSAEAASVSVGVISAIGRHGGRSVQTDAAISPANYGGPLVGLDGALLGVISPLAPAGMSGVEIYDSGIGFAIPPAQFTSRLDRLASGESIHPGWLGASFEKGDPLRSAPRVIEAARGGAAEAAGLAKSDTVLAIDGELTPSVWRLRSIVSGLDAGQRVVVSVRRADGGRESLPLRLGKRPQQASEPTVPRQQEKPDEP